MKAILITASLILFGLTTFAQTPKIVVNCTVYLGNVDYRPLDQLLPDSIKSRLLVDPRKEFNWKNGDNTLLWLEQQGWRVVAVYSGSVFLLSREISLDDSARAIFLQRLESLEAKKP
jgi:hypothetical protein